MCTHACLLYPHKWINKREKSESTLHCLLFDNSMTTFCSVTLLVLKFFLIPLHYSTRMFTESIYMYNYFFITLYDINWLCVAEKRNWIIAYFLPNGESAPILTRDSKNSICCYNYSYKKSIRTLLLIAALLTDDIKFSLFKYFPTSIIIL